MEALSGLTPALSRRLQRQLLAQLPPAAARTLRRTLSLQGARPNIRADSHTYARSQSDTKPVHVNDDPASQSDVTDHLNVDRMKKNDDFATVADSVSTMTDSINNNKELELPPSQFSTLPRSKRQSTTSRESTPPISPATDTGYDYAVKSGPPLYKELSLSRGSSVRSTPDRPLLSKYLTPERTASLDESYSSDSGSILSEPSYIAAYGSSTVPSLSGLGFRRHSMRLSGEQSKKRVSRFLRPDFFDSQSDENAYLKHKKEKELETQKILREIREKKNKPLDPVANVRSPTDSKELLQMFKDEPSYSRKCLSPIAIISGKERSRSNTPFFPILDNIKETVLDVPQKNTFSKPYDTKLKSCLEDIISTKESRLLRPKSYPVKNDDTSVQSQTQIVAETKSDEQEDCIQKSIQKESKLIRPKSYPTSSPSPEKIYINRNNKKDEIKNTTVKGDIEVTENNADVEVSFNINLPKKSKTTNDKTEIVHNCIDNDIKNESIHASKNEIGTSDDGTLTLRKYEIVDKKSTEKKTDDINILKTKSENSVSGHLSMNPVIKEKVDESKPKDQSLKLNSEVTEENLVKNDDDKNNKTDKKIVKKKVIKKVSSKSKTDVPNNQEDVKTSTDKKKVTKKIKEKCIDDKDTKTATITKKKSVLQSIGQKLEKLANKSNSPEKDKDTQNNPLPKDSQNNSLPSDTQSHSLPMNIIQSDNLIRKIDRQQREQSVPAHTDSTIESNLIKRAATLTNVTGLENQNTTSKTTVSKVLGLFKKFDAKEKVSKNTHAIMTSASVDSNVAKSETVVESESVNNTENEKPKRPTSLLLNGIGRRHKYVKNASDSVSVCAAEQTALKKDSDIKNLRNSLKLDFSRLPRVKKIAPTNSAIEPHIMDVSLTEKEDKKKDKSEKSNPALESFEKKENMQALDRSRSTSKSENSNPDNIRDNPVSPSESCALHPLRSHENTNPDKEDVVERIRRKSFYSRFNEKRQKRRSTLVGPGATEYDPVARIHGPPSENKYDLSPTSPVYDLSPGLSATSDLSPVAERYRSLGADYSGGVKTGYSLGDKLDSYRSLDRKDFRKAPVLKSYLDYDSTPTYGSHRYSRTLSLVDGPESVEDQTSGTVRDSLRYNRTLSMYSPGNYATYRPMRVRNSAILLKDGEKEPSPENVLDKIRQRKKASLTATKKPELEKETACRSNVPSKGEGDGAERSEKVD